MRVEKPVIGLENTGESLFNILMQSRMEAILKADTAQDVTADSPEKEKKRLITSSRYRQKLNFLKMSFKNS